MEELLTMLDLYRGISILVLLLTFFSSGMWDIGWLVTIAHINVTLSFCILKHKLAGRDDFILKEHPKYGKHKHHITHTKKR